eukprot:jgi/Ulvmu1/1001/UM103_0029.1
MRCMTIIDSASSIRRIGFNHRLASDRLCVSDAVCDRFTVFPQKQTNRIQSRSLRTSAAMASVRVSLDLKGTKWTADVPAEGGMNEAVMKAKQQAMDRISEFMAKDTNISATVEEVNVLEEEVPEDVDDGDDEIQQLAGEASHKPKKRKTGF